jgi:hypothetical protein
MGAALIETLAIKFGSDWQTNSGLKSIQIEENKMSDPVRFSKNLMSICDWYNFIKT